MSRPAIRLAFSPDSDDLFMFWPLLAGKVDAEGLEFEAERADTETLNARADAGDLDVVAVSIARWPSIADKYLLLPHGMSIGRGYGPVVVACGDPGPRRAGPGPRRAGPGPRRAGSGPRRAGRDLASLEGARIAVPGLGTTATMVLRLLLPRFDAVVVPISPYARVFEAVRSREVDAALLIHEGRLTYEREGLVRICDIGEGWAARTAGLPLPLGGNAIRRSLGADTIARVSRLCRASIAWALAHRDETMAALLERETRTDVGLDRAMLDRYLAMYANADTLDPPPDVMQAIDTLYARAHAAGLLDSAVRADFAP